MNNNQKTIINDNKHVIIEDTNNIINIEETINNNTNKLIYDMDILDLYNNIKQYLDEYGIDMLNKTPRHTQIYNFTKLMYKYIPENKNSQYNQYNFDNNNYYNNNTNTNNNNNHNNNDDDWQYV